MGQLRSRTTPQQDIPIGATPNLFVVVLRLSVELSRWGVVLDGNCPGGELSNFQPNENTNFIYLFH